MMCVVWPDVDTFEFRQLTTQPGMRVFIWFVTRGVSLRVAGGLVGMPRCLALLGMRC